VRRASIAAVIVAGVAAAGVAAPGRAGEDSVQLRDGPGRALVEAQCVACHSLDYIPMNSPIFDRAGWQGSVTKMIRVMGAPIDDRDAAAIVDYLATRYGR
jgi:mono/diheme cytochrome c family protein